MRNRMARAVLKQWAAWVLISSATAMLSAKQDGHIEEVKTAGYRGKGGYLSVVFDSVELPNGQKLPIAGSLTEVFFNVKGGEPNVGHRELKFFLNTAFPATAMAPSLD